ncbi:PREDICTED: uncharacterized protein LOC109462063 [Branchiostoma belcheri]|uniref:Leucine-rich repeat protein SHOC-2 n=1 Tax=Branchiostoma belcheri TaxID=7741 RepID=A0A6P4XPW3_BRABE|nr:PREDICTED: uncharacterized protein LOC109462063 [Branchiostoma belcheri]
MGVDLCTYRARIGCFRNPAFHPLCCWQSCLLVWMVISQLMLKLAGDVEENPGPRQQFKNMVKPKEWDMIGKRTLLTLDLSCEYGSHIKPLAQLPEEVFELKELEALDLTDNENIDISNQLTKLTNLKVLCLDNCDLKTVPAAVMKLPQLEMLVLSYNKNITLPDEMSGLINLTVLDLQNCNLKTVPAAVMKLPQLEMLVLSNNENITLPDEMSGLINLTVLHLQMCNLDTLPPVVLKLTNLQVLDLSAGWDSILKISVPDELSKLNKLKVLTLRYRNLDTVPPAVLTLPQLEELDLSGNSGIHLPDGLAGLTNLRVLKLAGAGMETVPPVVWRLTQLEWLDLSHNQLQTLPAEIGQLTNVKHLDLHNQLETLPAEIGQLTNVKHLDLSGCKLRTLPPEVGRQTQLEWLNLSSNQLQTLPAEIGQLTNVKHLDLSGCELRTLPPEVWRLTQLEWLGLSHNQLQTLPAEIGQLTNVKRLDLSGCWLRTLPPEVWRLTQLEWLGLSHNQLQTLPAEIGQLTNVKHLDLSGCELRILPPEVGRLTQLEWLNLSGYQLQTLPAEIGQLTNVKHLDLYGCELRILPPEVGRLTQLEWLDLRHNQLETLPAEVAQLSSLDTLSVRGNPLIKPPAEVCDQGIAAIRQYFEELERSKETISAHLKVVILGETMAGKTSLIQTLESGESTLTNVDDRTHCVEITQWAPDNNITFEVYDFGGHDVYHLTHQFFLTPDAFHLLLVNLQEYSCNEESYKKHVGFWLDTLNARVPGAVVSIVGSKKDLCQAGEVKAKTKDIQARIRLQRDTWEKEQRQIGEMTNIQIQSRLKSMEDIGHQQLRTLKPGLRIVGDALDFCVSVKPKSRFHLSRSSSSWERFRDFLLETAIDKELFPTLRRILPSTWVEFEQLIQHQDVQMSTRHWLTVTDCEQLGQLAGLSEERLEPVLSYLQQVGTILRYKDIPKLKDFVFHDPRALIELFKDLFHQDTSALFATPRLSHFTSAQLSTFQSDLCDCGLIRKEVMACLLPPNVSPDIITALMQHFGLCFEVQAKDNTDPSKHTRQYKIPWYLQKQMPEKLMRVWPKNVPEEQEQLQLMCNITGFCPRGLFQRFSVGIHPLFKDRVDWKDGVMAYRQDYPVLVCSKPVAGDTYITMATRGRLAQADEMWGVVHPLLEVLVQLLQEWPRVLYSLHVTCAHCIKAGLDRPWQFELRDRTTEDGRDVRCPEVNFEASTSADLVYRPGRLTGHGGVPLEIQLRGPAMQQLYSEACRQGAQRVYNVRGLVVGQFRSGKTCVVRRLTGEKAVENQPITDGIEIIPSVKTKTWRKAKEEPDEFKETMAERIAEQQERIKLRTQTSSRSQGGVRLRSNRKDPTDAGKAEEQQGKQKQQKEPMIKEAPTEGRETPRPEDERKEGISRTTSPQTPAQQQLQHPTQGIPDDERLQGDVRVHQKTQDIPDDVIIKAKERLQSGVTEEQLGTAENPRISFWDFGGQATYYGSHQCFFTYRGIYILVMSLLQRLSDPVPDLDYKASADNLVTGRDYLDHWLNSVHTHGLVPGQEEKEEPRVILVLTHKDKVSELYIEKYKKDIRDHISGMAAGTHVLPKIFVMDNFSEDNSDIEDLREYLREMAKDLSFMGQEVPITWLHLKSKLMDKRRQGDPFCRFQDVVDLARSDDIGITDVSHVADILTFLHDLGDIIFINEPVLRDHVTLRPQVMIDVFKTIITVPEYQQDRSTGGEVAEMWRRLETKGILSDRLVTIIWTKADQKMKDKKMKPFFIEHKDFLKRLMEKYYLLCNATPIGGFVDTADEPKKDEIYFVPSLLAAEPDYNTLYPGNMRRHQHPLYVVFDNMFLPSGMFYRLQAICVHRFGLKESHVFAGCGRFPTNDEKQQFVVTKVKHYLKVELLSAGVEEQPVFTQGLPVRKFLSSCLFEIKEKWIPYIQYDWCFGEESDEKNGTPAFYQLPVTEQEAATGSSCFPEDFINVWMGGSGDKRTSRAENSGGSGPAMIEPTMVPLVVHKISPLLDCLEMFGGLSFGECERIKKESTPESRFKKLLGAVNNAGDMCRRLLGASAEVCLPEIAPMFLREERGNEIVILHIDEYSHKLVQPLKEQASQSFSRYGVTVSEDAIEPDQSLKEELLRHLLKRNVRMVVPIITMMSLQKRYWPPLLYELYVQNKNLVFPVFAYSKYPKGTRECLLKEFISRCEDMKDMSSPQIPMTTEPLSSTKISLTAAQIMRKVSSSVVPHTYKITAEGCTVEEDGVTISFPTGCVEKERPLSFEVDILPIDDALTKAFSAVTPILTVHQGKEEDFLQPVSVTLPWAWRKSDHSCSKEKTILMQIKSHPSQWSLLQAEVHETEDAVTFTMRHSCRMAAAKESGNGGESLTSIKGNQDETSNREAADESNSREPNVPSASQTAVTTDALQACWNEYTKDKAYLIVNPNQATKFDNKIHLMCVHKDANPNVFFRAANMLPLPPFQQSIVMGRDDTINATFDNSKEVIGHPDDVSDGISFVFPPAARGPPKCNRWSVKLIPNTPRPARKTHMYQGAIDFRLLTMYQEQITDPWRRILPAQVSLDSDEECSDQPEDHNASGNPPDELKVGKDDVAGTSAETSDQLKRSQDQDAPDQEKLEDGKGEVSATFAESSYQHQDHNVSGNPPEELKCGKAAGTLAGSDFTGYFRYIKNNVTAEWKDLADLLLSWDNVKDIEKRNSDDRSRCWDALKEWQKSKGEAATMAVLMDALKEVDLMSVVDGLKSKFPEFQDHDASGNPPAEGASSREDSAVKGGRHSKGLRLPVILLISDEYGTSKGGISTINCEASQIVKGKAVMYATALHVTKQDQDAADRDGVTLIGPVQLDKNSVPTLDWLTYYHDKHYPNLPQDVTCIIGHADITDTAARNIKDQRYPQANLIMFTHVIPEDTEYYKGGRKAVEAREKEEDMLDKVHNAKAAFSVGKRIYDHCSTKYKGKKKPQNHHIFLPKPSKIFLDADVSPGGGEKVVLSVGRVRKVEKLKGHDLVGESMRDVVKIIKNTRWCVRGISEDASQKILEDALNSPDLNPTLLPYGTQEDIRDDMMTAHLVLMPSRSEPFGLVGLEAIAAGIPVLISDKTGLADMILDLIKEKKLSAEHRNIIVETSVNDRDRAGDAKRWADRIVDILEHSDSEFAKAARFKRELVESRYWEESHNAFLQACGITNAAADQ